MLRDFIYGLLALMLQLVGYALIAQEMRAPPLWLALFTLVFGFIILTYLLRELFYTFSINKVDSIGGE